MDDLGTMPLTPWPDELNDAFEQYLELWDKYHRALQLIWAIKLALDSDLDGFANEDVTNYVIENAEDVAWALERLA